MRHVVTTGIVLRRINYGEADRIITVITPDNGKLRLMAKGVRKVKSKMAGGIELFSISSITFIPGKKEIHTLISTRLVIHYGDIVANIARTKAAYNFLSTIDKATEDECGIEFFELLVKAFGGLNEKTIDVEVLECWFSLRLLRLLGHEPNLLTTPDGEKLTSNQSYLFDFEIMAFLPSASGKYEAAHIKVLRLLLEQSPEKVNKIIDIDKLTVQLRPLIKMMSEQFIK